MCTFTIYFENTVVSTGRSHILRPCSDSAIAKLATGAIYDSDPSGFFHFIDGGVPAQSESKFHFTL